MVLPHSQLLLVVHSAPVPEEGLAAQLAGVALNPVSRLVFQNETILKLLYYYEGNCSNLVSSDRHVPDHQVRVLAGRQEGLLRARVVDARDLGKAKN